MTVTYTEIGSKARTALYMITQRRSLLEDHTLGIEQNSLDLHAHQETLAGLVVPHHQAHSMQHQLESLWA